MKKLLSIIISLFILTGISTAQEYAPIKDVDILKQHEEFLWSKYPHLNAKANIQKVQAVNDKHSLIYVKAQGEQFQILVNKGLQDMMLIAEYRKIRTTKVPQIVLDNFMEDHSKAVIKSAFKVKDPHSEPYYALLYKKDGKKSRVHYTDMGRKKKSPF